MNEPKDYKLPEGFYLMNNIADHLDEEILSNLGARLKDQINTDIGSRKEWLDKNDKWMELVTQVIESKTYPWPNASNIKFPLISTAAVQFHARAFPALLGNNKPVKARVIGQDPKSLKAERAGRVSTYMSYQVMESMDGWVDDMDRLLFIVPIIGSLYKKTYYSEQKRNKVSELIHPRDFIINYDAIDIKDARKTHRIWKLPNTIVELQNRGLYRTIPEEKEDGMVIEATKTHSIVKDEINGLTNPGTSDDYSLQELYEVHCLLDMDGDGYKEPYVVTLRESDGKVYRIVANYDDEGIETDGEKILAITPKDFFTHYFFLPDPESKTHGIGFGTMIGPINSAVNTILNQLTDAGHVNTLGGGFLSRGVRIKGGALKFKPNEWKVVNSSGDDLRKGIVPLPTKEPSTVLFQLLGLLIDSGKDLSSVQDLMVGRNPGQNQPYSTSQMVMEQGMKVFNGIYKRLYRSMTSEFKKLYTLNRKHPNVVEYMNVLDLDGQEISQAANAPSLETGQPQGIEGVLQYLAEDFKANDIDIIPTAEPDMVAEMQKVMRAGALMEKLQAGVPLNREEVLRRTLEAEGHENVPKLMAVEPAPPPFDEQMEEKKFAHQQQMDGLKARLDQLKTESEVMVNQMTAELTMAQAQNESIEGLHAQFMEQKRLNKEEFDAVTQRLKVLIDGKNGAARKQASGAGGTGES